MRIEHEMYVIKVLAAGYEPTYFGPWDDSGLDLAEVTMFETYEKAEKYARNFADRMAGEYDELYIVTVKVVTTFTAVEEEEFV